MSGWVLTTKTVFNMHLIDTMNSLNTGLNNRPVFLLVRSEFVDTTHEQSLKVLIWQLVLCHIHSTCVVQHGGCSSGWDLGGLSMMMLSLCKHWAKPALLDIFHEDQVCVSGCLTNVLPGCGLHSRQFPLGVGSHTRLQRLLIEHACFWWRGRSHCVSSHSP